MKSLVMKYPVASFLILNYLISWSFLYPSYQLILANDGITPLALIGLIGAYGPTIAALLVQAVVDRSAIKELWRKIIQVKVGGLTYLLVVLFPILVYAVAFEVSLAYYGASAELNVIAGLGAIPVWLLAALPFGPMGEELGWRGFMLPRLLDRYSPIASSVLVGLAWGGWHLAAFTFPGAALPSHFDINLGTIALYCSNTVALSFFYTYLHLRSKGSVFVAILLHAFFNAASNIVLDFLVASDNADIQTMVYIGNIVLTGVLGLLFLSFRKRQSG